MTSLRPMIASVLAAMLVAAPVAPAQAGLLDPLFQKTSFPECDDASVLSKIVERFNWAEDATWQRGFYLENIELTRERLVQSTHVSPIPRRYCRAHARLTDGTHPTLLYLIEGGQGLAGNHYNVEFCLQGFDRWNEYDGSCRVLNY